MTGSALIDFVITLVVIMGTGALFFIAIDRAAPDPMMNKIGKIAIGVVIAVVVLLAVKGLLFGGGALVLTAGGIIGFAIGVIVILVLLFLVDLVLNWLGGQISEPIVSAVKYIVFAVVLIALLVLADKTFFGGRYLGVVLGDTPSIVKPERR
jgi:hypothetical protein